jgi:hypothetical protein
MQDALLATPLIPAAPTPPAIPIPLLHRLPPELIDHLLDHIPPQLLQRTALSLAQVFPPDTISARYVWKHLTVGRPGQLKPLWMKLKEEARKGERGGVRHVRTFCQVRESRSGVPSVVSRIGLEMGSGSELGLLGLLDLLGFALYPADCTGIMARRRRHPQQVSDMIPLPSASRGVTTRAPGAMVRTQSNPRSVLRCLPDVQVLLLNIGTNFAPEHLEEMFEDPRPGIRRMEMRFRPYVEQASYYQFLKGA